MRLVYSREAVADLARLREFIADNNPDAAARIAADLIARIDHLCAFPKMGRGVSSAPDPEMVRDFIFGKYVVRYLVSDQAIVILRIWHHYEDTEDRT